MAYKRNPMRAERLDALARHLIVNSLNPALTAATQWFERTLDDSANRRIAIPEAFLAADALALIYDNIVAGLVVHEDVIAANVRRELPLMMTENLMMEGVRRVGTGRSCMSAYAFIRKAGARICWIASPTIRCLQSIVPRSSAWRARRITRDWRSSRRSDF